MGREVVLALGPFDPAIVERLSHFGTVVEVDVGDRSAIERHLPDTIAIAARAWPVLDADLIGAAPRLRVIGRSGVGVDQIDLHAATAGGIPVVITPNAGARAVAEGSLALMLHLLKRLGRLTELVRDGRWDEREQLEIGDLAGATLGIVGYGRIGRVLGEIASALGMQVLAYDPFAGDGAAASGATMVGLDELVAASHVVSLHAPLTAETRCMIDAGLLEKFRPGAVLINCGRGALLDLDAVHAALKTGRLGGVGLDVYAEEPPPAHPIFEHPDVVLTPHVLGLSRRARRLIFEAMAEGMEAVLSGRRAPHVANPDVYEGSEATSGGGES